MLSINLFSWVAYVVYLLVWLYLLAWVDAFVRSLRCLLGGLFAWVSNGLATHFCSLHLFGCLLPYLVGILTWFDLIWLGCLWRLFASTVCLRLLAQLIALIGVSFLVFGNLGVNLIWLVVRFVYFDLGTYWCGVPVCWSCFWQFFTFPFALFCFALLWLMNLLTWFASKWLACWAWLVTCINYVIWIGVEISLAWFGWMVDGW